MTEEEWLTATNPTPMLECLRRRASDRKVRLFGVVCCRRVSELLLPSLGVFDEGEQGIEVAERYADDLASEEELQRIHLFIEAAKNMRFSAVDFVTASVERELWLCAEAAVYDLEELPPSQREELRQVALVRDIFGNPFRPAALDPAWLTSTVVALAEGVYQDRAFDRMPILADALQDANCDSDDILNHCRDTALTHVRGCWVIDLLTGRK